MPVTMSGAADTADGLEIDLTVGGLTATQAVLIDWGDGSALTAHTASSSVVAASHDYPVLGSYQVSVLSRDSAGVLSCIGRDTVTAELIETVD